MDKLPPTQVNISTFHLAGADMRGRAQGDRPPGPLTGNTHNDKFELTRCTFFL